MDTNLIWSEFGKLIAVAGGTSAASFAIFRLLGKSWIEAKFAERLENLRHQQSLEVQRLRVEIESLLSGTIRMQEREFAILPECWNKLEEARALTTSAVTDFYELPNFNNLGHSALEDLLKTLADWTQSDKEALRNAHDKNKTYVAILSNKRIWRAEISISTLAEHVEKNSIFIPSDIRAQLREVSKTLRSMVIGYDVGKTHNDFKLLTDAKAKIESELTPQCNTTEQLINQRLQSHASSARKL